MHTVNVSSQPTALISKSHCSHASSVHFSLRQDDFTPSSHGRTVLIFIS